MPTIDVALLPGRVRRPIPPVAVVVDVLRATTMIAALIDAGAAGVRPVETVGLARSARREDPDLLLAGERGGLAPEGFDMGNSPSRIDPAAVRGRTVVLTTTNGTAAIADVGDAERCFALALTNLDAVADRLQGLCRDAVIVCSGTDGGRSDEDELAAGMLVERLNGWARSASAEDAMDRAIGSIGACGGVAGAVARSAHAHRLVGLGFGDDVAFCSRVSVSRTVPRLDGVRGLMLPD